MIESLKKRLEQQNIKCRLTDQGKNNLLPITTMISLRCASAAQIYPEARRNGYQPRNNPPRQMEKPHTEVTIDEKDGELVILNQYCIFKPHTLICVCGFV